MRRVEQDLPALFIVSAVKVHEVWEAAPAGAVPAEDDWSLKIVIRKAPVRSVSGVGSTENL